MQAAVSWVAGSRVQLSLARQNNCCHCFFLLKLPCHYPHQLQRMPCSHAWPSNMPACMAEKTGTGIGGSVK
jgi:hypothetical protein